MTDQPKQPTKKKRPGPVPGTKWVRGSVRHDSGLTVEQEAYCRARAMGMSIEEAHLACGLKLAVSTCKTWERKVPAVAKRINELSAMATENAILQTGLNREWVISRLMSVAERCMQAEPVLDKEGTPTGEYKFDASGANQALRMLGDTMGLFKPAEKKPEDDYANLSDDDLRRIAAELASQTGLLEHLKGPDDRVIDV